MVRPLLLDFLKLAALFVGAQAFVFFLCYVILWSLSQKCNPKVRVWEWLCLSNCSSVKSTICDPGETGFDSGLTTFFIYSVFGVLSLVTTVLSLIGVYRLGLRNSFHRKCVFVLLFNDLALSLKFVVTAVFGFIRAPIFSTNNTPGCYVMALWTQLFAFGSIGWNLALMVNMLFLVVNPELFARLTQRNTALLIYTALVWLPLLALYIAGVATGQVGVRPNGTCWFTGPLVKTLYLIFIQLACGLFSIIFVIRRLRLSLLSVHGHARTNQILQAFTLTLACVFSWFWPFMSIISHSQDRFFSVTKLFAEEVMISSVGFVSASTWALAVLRRPPSVRQRSTSLHETLIPDWNIQSMWSHTSFDSYVGGERGTSLDSDCSSASTASSRPST